MLIGKNKILRIGLAILLRSVKTKAAMMSVIQFDP
jgi:hypothetical protein